MTKTRQYIGFEEEIPAVNNYGKCYKVDGEMSHIFRQLVLYLTDFVEEKDFIEIHSLCLSLANGIIIGTVGVQIWKNFSEARQDSNYCHIFFIEHPDCFK